MTKAAIRVSVSIWLCIVVLGVFASAVQRADGEQFLGTWTGTWEGSGAGGFELTLEKGAAGLAGRVSVTGEPTYQATFKSLSFTGANMSAKYDVPTMDGVEVVLTAAFEGQSAKGTWSARDQSGTDLVSGTFTVTRK